MREAKFVLGAWLIATLAACGGGAAGAMKEAGALKVHVTDAPFRFDLVASATVVVSAIEVHDLEGDGWTKVYEGPTEVDLVPLTGGVSTLLGQASLPPGTYDRVRLIVDGGEVVLDDEAFVDHPSHTFDAPNGGLLFPSAARTGIKVRIDPPIEVSSGLSADLLLDVDLSRSFVFNGTPDHAPGVRRVLFAPVVRATNKSTTGRATLEVRSDSGTPADAADDAPLAGASVTALDGVGAEVGGAVADASGRVEVVLPPGTYDLLVEAAGHEAETVEDVEISLANATPLPIVTLASTSTSIAGTVRSDAGTADDLADDVPLEGVTVTAVSAAGGDPVATTTDAEGAYLLEDLPPGTYDLSFTKDGFEEGAVLGVVSTAEGATAGVTLVARP